MLIARLGLVRLILALAFMTGVGSESRAVEWFDDFSDGNANDGTPLDWFENLGGFFPGTYDASSGDYVLTPAVDGLPDSQIAAFVTVPFTDVYMRTQGIVLPDPVDPLNVGGNLVLTARVDPTTLSGYLVYFDVSGNLNLQILLGGATADIGTTFDAPFNAGSEVIVELNIVGDLLSAYAWEVGDPNGKPDSPQATATDPTFTAGVSGVAFAEDDDLTTGVFRYVAAQDTPFLDGDYNDNGTIDAADYALWRDGGPLKNDATEGVQPLDYNIWAKNFGEGAGPGSGSVLSAVPEPAGFVLVLAAIGASFLGGCRRAVLRLRCRLSECFRAGMAVSGQ